MFVPLLGRLRRSAPQPVPVRDSSIPFARYEARAPGPQNCIDAIPGWVSAFPLEYGLTAGSMPLFTDWRIRWLMELYGDVTGANVLEIGPLEAAHTTMLHQAGANITAVEANKQAFLKCLVTKELAGLTRAKFLLGDCVQYLEQNEARYDFILACGVLYHMTDPWRFLAAVAARTDALFLWTQYIEEDALTAGTLLADAFAARREIGEFRGVTTTLYKMNYGDGHLNDDFCGGIYDAPRWANRASILGALKALGFENIAIAHEDNPLPHQPSFSIFARR